MGEGRGGKGWRGFFWPVVQRFPCRIHLPSLFIKKKTTQGFLLLASDEYLYLVDASLPLPVLLPSACTSRFVWESSPIVLREIPLRRHPHTYLHTFLLTDIFRETSSAPSHRPPLWPVTPRMLQRDHSSSFPPLSPFR